MYLGKGSYGYVTKHKNVAKKEFFKLTHIIQEYTALNYLKDCNYIVHPSSVNYDKQVLYMELYDKSLRTWMNEECCCSECINIIIHDVLCGLIELQDRNLSHSDVKPGNILIQKEPLKAVLGDCGFVSIAKYSKQQRTAPSYRDINIVNDNKHDMYSFGVCFLELIYGVKPKIYKNYKHIYKTIDKHVTDNNHVILLKKLMHENRDKRPCAREVLKLLYNDDVSIYNVDKYNYHKLTENKEVNKIIKHVCKKLNIKRGVKGYYALLYIVNHNHIDNNVIHYYIASTLIILASLFVNHTPNITDIINYCNINPDHCHKKILKIINILTNDKVFLNIIFT